MRTTTMRFPADLWRVLEYEARLSGVSVSQYVREAALARAAAAAAARGDGPFEALANAARAEQRKSGSLLRRADVERALGALARALSREQRDDAAALKGQSRQVLRHAAGMREEGRTPGGEDPLG